jgi:S-layer family protein
MKAVAVVAGLLLLPGVVLAADNRSSAPDAVVEGSATLRDGPLDTFGASRTFSTATAWDVQPIDTSTTYGFTNAGGGQGIFRIAGTSFFKLPVHVPAGAIVSEVEFNYCDTGASSLTAFWFRQVKNAPPVVTTLFTSVGTPGCVVQNVTFAAQTIDNNANSYNIEMSMADATIVFLSARVGYRLQVSPAPATATFPNDVPTTHPLFRFVEALAASGITGGCGGGSYCPDAPLTRGQMAVFLAVALGLHFPN